MYVFTYTYTDTCTYVYIYIYYRIESAVSLKCANKAHWEYKQKRSLTVAEILGRFCKRGGLSVLKYRKALGVRRQRTQFKKKGSSLKKSA